MKTLALNLLTKIATIVVALLIYGVIVILQTPKAARADDGVTPRPTHGSNSQSVQHELGVLHQFAPFGDFALDQRVEGIGRAAHGDRAFGR